MEVCINPHSAAARPNTHSLSRSKKVYSWGGSRLSRQVCLQMPLSKPQHTVSDTRHSISRNYSIWKIANEFSMVRVTSHSLTVVRKTVLDCISGARNAFVRVRGLDSVWMRIFLFSIYIFPSQIHLTMALLAFQRLCRDQWNETLSGNSPRAREFAFGAHQTTSDKWDACSSRTLKKQAE